jgi:signal transduction histidine kinase/ActR/RegA family two-component response regulator
LKGMHQTRSAAAKKAGLNGAVGIPIKVGSELYGVIEFFTAEQLESRPSLTNMFEVVGSEIGQFMFRRRVEKERESLLIREKQLRQQAERASKLKDEFLATVSHELRTPLNSILGWSQLLALGKLDEEEAKGALDTIHRNARSQAQLIDDLLDTSRLITGNLQLELSPTDVRPLIDAAVEMVKPAADSKNVTIDSDVDDSIDSLTCDAQRLQQMIWNLLTNAVKFTPSNGKIDINCQRRDGMVEIRVTDSGIGIAADFLPFVFDRFRQEDSSSTRSNGGLGLGLSIVRHLAELHGGNVSVESEGPGQGATFSISLPVTHTARSEKHEVPETAVDPNSGEPTRLSGLRLLVVDDDEDSCNMLRFALSSSGAEVKTSLSVSDAFQCLSKWIPHVLLTDINMPGEDGYSLINRLRALEDESRSNLPVIALTAMARPEDGEKAMSSGFQLHIPKPVDIEELTKAISNLANGFESKNASHTLG